MAYDEHGVKTESFSVAFEPAGVGRFWQHNATRMMRANERIMNGIFVAARREMELVQELAHYNLSRLNSFSEAGRPEQGEQNVREFQHIMAGLREVTEDLWKTFGDASKLLLEGSLTEAREAASEAMDKGMGPVQAASESFKSALDSAAE